jgi:hypothetical protein
MIFLRPSDSPGGCKFKTTIVGEAANMVCRDARLADHDSVYFSGMYSPPFQTYHIQV